MEYIDYYKVLGIERGASAEDITKAYRRLARKFHPDVSKEPGAEDKFKRVNEAHQVLSDPEKRRKYDTLGPEWHDGQPFRPPPDWGDGMHVEFRSYPGGGMGGGGWSDFFESIFGGAGAGMGGAPGRARRSGRRRKVPSDPFTDVRQTTAGHAGAEPLDPGLEDLFGQGFGGGPARRGPARGADVEGGLEVSLEEALRGGTRTVQLTNGDGGIKTYEIKIPPGVRDGTRIRLGGRGGAGRAGAPSGDLMLTVRIAAHSRFRREGNDLVVVVPVAPWEAALGTSVRVPTPDGAVEMKLPAGRSSGDRLRLRGKGLPGGDAARGDLYAEVRIVVPERLSDRERELFEELRAASGFRPRDE